MSSKGSWVGYRRGWFYLLTVLALLAVLQCSDAADRATLQSKASTFATDLDLRGVRCSFDLTSTCSRRGEVSCVGVTAAGGSVFFSCTDLRCEISAAGVAVPTGAEADDGQYIHGHAEGGATCRERTVAVQKLIDAEAGPLLRELFTVATMHTIALLADKSSASDAMFVMAVAEWRAYLQAGGGYCPVAPPTVQFYGPAGDLRLELFARASAATMKFFGEETTNNGD